MKAIGAASHHQSRLFWLGAAGAIVGAGAWATHFIAMLAFDAGVATGYNLTGTLASLAVAVAGMMLNTLWTAGLKRPWNLVAWGLLFGSSIGAMHYIGMMTMDIPGRMSWNIPYVVASVLLGGILSSAALYVQLRWSTFIGFILASLCLTVAICSLHFTGMAAVTLTADPTIAIPKAQLPHATMAIWVSALAALILLSALLTAWVDQHTHRSSLKLLHSVIDAVPHGVAYFDADDRFILGNEAYRIGLGADGVKPARGLLYREILQRALELRSVPEAVNREAEWLADLMAARAGAANTRYQRMSDGRFLCFESNRTDDGGLVTVVSDVTTLKQQADDLTASRDLAEAAVRAKSEFLANMSHEIRTPMNGVLGVADLLAREALTPRQTELVSIIQASGATLDRVLRDLLEGATLEAGVVEITEAPLDLTVALKAIVGLFTPRAVEKGVSLSLRLPAKMADRVRGDEVRIKQILGNLLSNAVKFTEHGSIDISLDHDGASAIFRVADTGIGFDPEFGHRIFSRFEQADGSITRRFGGSGLGLSIARDLALRMGGDLVCESTAGAGSVFTLTLPLRECGPAEHAPPNVQIQPESTHILIVDDSPTNQRVLALMLEAAEICTVLADNGEEAVTQWRTGLFDAILMDIQMPVLDGLSATAAIRAEESERGLTRTPIIMVSANASPVDIEASRAAGADGHVAKPVTAERLFAALGSAETPTPGSSKMAA
ncbi:ATP-binding protein [Caulobacter sp. S45]|uniref:ATP-binding protein n=1 Tax=Caulobacter sp. S45 TaxID=1641861 RepID=UPI00352A9737